MTIRSAFRGFFPIGFGVVLVTVAALSARQQQATQPALGAAVYQTNCAGCHMPDLGGRNEAPPLAGANFMTTWGGRSTRDLLRRIQTTMPPGKPDSLPATDYLNLVAFILASNGSAE